MKYLLIALLALSGISCATLNPQGKVTKTKDGLIFDLNTQGKITYKEKDGVEGEMDTRSPSLLRSIVEGAVVQGMSLEK